MAEEASLGLRLLEEAVGRLQISSLHLDMDKEKCCFFLKKGPSQGTSMETHVGVSPEVQILTGSHSELSHGQCSPSVPPLGPLRRNSSNSILHL